MTALERPVVALVAGTSTYVVGVAAGVSPEHVEVLKLLAGVVAAIVAALAWIDYRIERKMKKELDAHNRVDRMRHGQIRRDFRHGFEHMAIQLNVKLPVFEDEEDELQGG